MNYKLSKHAKIEIERRNIPLSVIDSVLLNPQQIIEEEHGKVIFQSKLPLKDGKIYLVRIVVRINIEPPLIITAYCTSKIDKYWRQK